MAAGDEILAWKKAAAEQKPIEDSDCPICAWPLEKTEDGIRHCRFCGWTSGLR